MREAALLQSVHTKDMTALLVELQQLREAMQTAEAQLTSGRSREEEMEREHAAQAEAEREKRVAHLQQIAARRISQLGLSRGWSAWVGEYEAQRRQRQLLAAAAGRLLRPKLSACLSVWRHDWCVASPDSIGIT